MSDIDKLCERLRKLSAYGCCLEAAAMLEAMQRQIRELKAGDAQHAEYLEKVMESRANSLDNLKAKIYSSNDAKRRT